MNWFLTRVELHKADNYNISAEDYETLHNQMAKEGFKRTITSDEKEAYQLPTAEYFKETDDEIEVVKDAAKRAAFETVSSSFRVKDYSVIVAKSSQFSWRNLQKVTQLVN